MLFKLLLILLVPIALFLAFQYSKDPKPETLYREATRVWFALNLLGSMLMTVVLSKIIELFGMKKRKREGYVLMMTQACWRYVLLVCTPMIPVIATETTADAYAKFIADHSANPDKKSFILGNHVSFLDTIMTVVTLPQAVLWYTRTYMSSHLYGLPILGTICKAIGHFPVYFTSSENGVFSVDREKMGEVDKDIDDHLANEGVLAFFPEGQMNKTPDNLNSFRYGGFKKALSVDARLWALVTYGNQHVWPKAAALGGFPSPVFYDMAPIAPEGCKKLAETLRASLPADQADYADDRILAEHCRKVMQETYNRLKARSEVTKKINQS